MENKLEKLSDNVDDIRRIINTFNHSLDHIKYIHRRLDSHLVKLGKADEKIIMLKTKGY